MRSSRTITLFSERPEESQRPFSFILSILVHGAVAGLVAYGILYAPKLNRGVPHERYAVRRLDLNTPEQQVRGAAGGGIAYPGPVSRAHARSFGRKQAPVAQPAALRQAFAQLTPGLQTLVQPNIHSKLTLPVKIPVPNVVIWSPEKTAVKTIVPPKPDKPAAADVQPMLDPPNQELHVADRDIASTDVASPTLAILASTTSPVAVHGPDQAQTPPATTSNSSAPPTPAAVLSQSDLRMKNGSAMLPPVNETLASASPGALEPGETKQASQAKNGNPAIKADDKGAEQGSGDQGSKADQAAGNGKEPKTAPAQGTETGSAAGKQPSAGHPAGGGAVGAGKGSGNQGEKPGSANNATGSKTGSAQGAESGSGTGNQPGADHITLPKDGQFSSVVVGSSLDDKFPESAGLMGGRLAYTVYLHVGLAKSWILQYSLPRSAEAAEAGNITRMDAPWPYNIVRPNIDPDAVNADALLIHGFVNEAGRFEALSVAFPPEFPQKEFVLGALQQWQFRPAAQNGRSVKVEVLLIVPEELQ